jgi:hypothetical protein
MANIEVLNVNVDIIAVGFDDDGANEMTLGSNEVSRPVVGSISTPNAPTPSESITTLNTSNPKVKAAWELLKIQLSFNQKAWIPHSRTSLPWHFSMVNDDNKPNPTLSQTMCYIICHTIS